MNITALILAAGKGKRMKSKLIKNLHLLSGKPMVSHVIESAREAGTNEVAVVIGNDAEKVRATLGEGYYYVYQTEQLGTGHAVMQAESFLSERPDSIVLVILGDSPLVTPETLRGLINAHIDSHASASLLVEEVDNPTGLGRIVRNTEGEIQCIVEEADATPEQKKIREVWTGFSCFSSKELVQSLKAIDNNNAQGEYYLTSIIKVLAKDGLKIASASVQTPGETMNVNDRVTLAKAEQVLQDRYQKELMEQGVTIVSPQTTYIEKGVQIGQDTVIMPYVYLGGSTIVGSDCYIGSFSEIRDCVIGNSVTFERSTATGATLEDEVTVGPFAYLRPGTHLASKSKAGRFVEIKNSFIGKGSKVPHLSYIGDTDVGQNVNFGAATVVVNYDGKHKHRTTVDDRAFIGCNSNLVAPVHIGEDAYVAAGSTVTKEVPPKSLAVARARQKNIQGWVERKREEWSSETPKK